MNRHQRRASESQIRRHRALIDNALDLICQFGYEGQTLTHSGGHPTAVVVLMHSDCADHFSGHLAEAASQMREDEEPDDE